MREKNADNISGSLSPGELEILKKKFPILSRIDPAMALELFRGQQPPSSSVKSPFTRSAQTGKLPPKDTTGK